MPLPRVVSEACITQMLCSDGNATTAVPKGKAYNLGGKDKEAVALKQCVARHLLIVRAPWKERALSFSNWPGSEKDLQGEGREGETESKSGDDCGNGSEGERGGWVSMRVSARLRINGSSRCRAKKPER